MEALKRTQVAFLSKGKEKEKEFMSLFSKAAESTKEEDMHGHIDLKVFASVDVKAMKKISRDDKNTTEQFHWVEIKGVKDAGWLYGGHADFITFETQDYWIVVDRMILQEFVKKKIQKKWVTNPREALYKLYRRAGRRDIITLVKTMDLMKISTIIYDKV